MVRAGCPCRSDAGRTVLLELDGSVKEVIVSIYRLDQIFAPRSVALMGSSARANSSGAAVLAKLREQFQGPIYSVNPHYDSIEGLPCYPSLSRLPVTPDVLVIVVPAALVRDAVAEAAQLGVGAAIILSDGPGGAQGSTVENIRAVARKSGLRLVGPNCLGVIAPHARFDASLMARAAAPGRLALLSQSGAVVAAMLEWAGRHGVGFSGVIALGEEVDVDLADCLDYFAQDRASRAILVYLKGLKDARKFMSAARAAARVKPVVVVKSGRHLEGSRSGQSHSNALAEPDSVYDAAFRRAGLLRVYDLEELFVAAESLTWSVPFDGDRVAIVSNGSGIGDLAADRLVDLGGRLAPLDDQARVLPRRSTGQAGVIDIGGDADAARYAATVELLLANQGIDAVLVVNCPTALMGSEDIAVAIAETVKTNRSSRAVAKPVFAVWLERTPAAMAAFGTASIAHYATEADGVRGLMHLVDHARARKDLMKVSPSVPEDFFPDVGLARSIVNDALRRHQYSLAGAEIATILDAYSIATTPVKVARTAAEAGQMAAEFLAQGAAVAVKVLSQQIVHKLEAGAVVLNLASEAAVRASAEQLLDRLARERPDAVIDGLAIQPMVHRERSIELIAGIADDPIFGPVIVFGRGGTAVAAINDKALALPPLDLRLAAELIERTRVHRRLATETGGQKALDAVALTLVKLAQLAADVPEIRELDLNPMVVDSSGIIVLDARAFIATVPASRDPSHPRFAIKPYPKELETVLHLRDGSTVQIRPIRPEDEILYDDFFSAVTDEDLRLRFFAAIRARDHALIARLTQLDYARAMALAAIEPTTGALLGVVRLHLNADRDEGEYAILLRSKQKGRGLGWELMQLIIQYAQGQGVKRISGQVLSENTTMLAMCRQLGFALAADPDDPSVTVATLDLTKPRQA
jgi:acetyltransferase